MPLNQVYEMQWAYQQVGRHAEVLILHGASTMTRGPSFVMAR